VASEAGISHTTARAWLSVLESSDVLFLLTPYHRNFGKRLVKSPKLYFVDTGLACWLLGIRQSEQLSLHPSRGALFENWVVTEFLKHRANQGQPSDLHFWRDNNGLEADLLYETGTGRLQTVEIKSGQTPTGDYVRAGQRSASMAAAEACTPLLIYGGDTSVLRNGVQLLSWRMLARKD
jgi:predicted AAA+ superfamily ATPase